MLRKSLDRFHVGLVLTDVFEVLDLFEVLELLQALELLTIF